MLIATTVQDAIDVVSQAHVWGRIVITVFCASGLAIALFHFLFHRN
jgi:predicted membrane channel-forming protein YqfA (hemolysin III family)